jgi:hypothetical protein
MTSGFVRLSAPSRLSSLSLKIEASLVAVELIFLAVKMRRKPACSHYYPLASIFRSILTVEVSELLLDNEQKQTKQGKQE